MTDHRKPAARGSIPGRPGKTTTAVTAWKAITAAERLRRALADLGQLYGAHVDALVGPDRISLSITSSTGRGDLREALAGDLCEITGADLHPHVGADLWITLTGRGEHCGTPVGVVLLVPPGPTEDGDRL